jgi:beta-barrel assembly-enhancing protease
MHPLKGAIYLFALLSITGIHAQIDFDEYRPAKSTGDIPSRLKESSAIKARRQIDRINEKISRRSQKRIEREHAIQSNYLEDELLSSGQALYGEAMSNYVEKVGLKVLDSHPELIDKIQFYVLRSDEPNVYTTSNGLVFVSVGLLARLENEAQLAVVLAHEIQHFIENHALMIYKGMVGAQLNIKEESIEKRLSLLYRFSQEQELQADKLGFKMLENSLYDLTEGIRGLKILKYADYSFLETTWNIDSLFGSHVEIPTELQSDIQQRIENANLKNESNDKNDLLNANRTHPQIDYRVLVLKDLMAESSYLSDGKQQFLVPQEEFAQAQKIAVHELMLLHLSKADYGRVLYLSRVFELLYGPTKFISRAKSMAIYGMVHHKYLDHNLQNYGCNILQNRGGWRPLTAGLIELSPQSLAALSLRITWAEKSRYPDDKFIDKCWLECLKMARFKGIIDLEAILSYAPKSTDSIGVDGLIVLSDSAVKSQMIATSADLRNMIVKPQSRESDDWFISLFYDLPEKELLKSKIKSWLKENTVNLTRSDDWGFESSSRNMDRKRFDKINPDFKGLIMLQPRLTYRKVYATGQKERNFLIEEKSKSTLYHAWQEVSKTSELPVRLIHNHASEKLSTKDINRYSRAKDWLTERTNNDTHSMVLFMGQYLSELKDSSKNNLLGWTAYDYEIQKRPFDFSGLMYAILLPPYAPFFLYQQSQVDAATRQLTYVYNLETGRQVYIHSRARTSKWHKDMLRAHIYETVYYIAHATNLK